MIYGYTRGSNGTIDQRNQANKIKEYTAGMGVDVNYIEDTVSSGKPLTDRKIFEVLNLLEKDDILVCAELSRMARNTEEVLKVGRLAVERGATIVVLNPSLEINAGLNSKIMLTVLGMAAEIERYYVRSRTRLAFEVRKKLIEKDGYFISKEGKKIRQLGTPPGSKKQLKIEGQIEQLHGLVNKGVTQANIAKILGVSRHTIGRTLKRFPIA